MPGREVHLKVNILIKKILTLFFNLLKFPNVSSHQVA